MNILINILVGDRLRRLREDIDKTQEQVAEVLGAYQSHVSKIEHGSCGFVFEELFEYAEALEVSPDDLFDALQNDLIEFSRADAKEQRAESCSSQTNQ